MEATSFIPRPMLSGRLFPPKSPCRRRLVPVTKKTIIASVRKSGHDYGGRPVDENMIILRMRIREAKMLEQGSSIRRLRIGWSGRNATYYAHYNEDVCEAVGLLQSFFMDTRPCLAFGMAALSVTLSTSGVLFYVIRIAKRLLCGFHLS
ncbi:uncharacterized protein LOC132282156 [Cornus florida]|uniref:uncharacterized protein LOC132282156 n=1 Tax=Cornus florida TaxID=4283 RepID=UPI002899AB5C|nr:uncharacterized protein LOC132282156 [Cornus florida]